MKYIFLLLIFFTSCALRKINLDENWQGELKQEYSFKDMSGQYNLLRETKRSKSDLVVRQILYTPFQQELPLEKTVSVSKVGTIGARGKRVLILRPEITQHTIWFEKQKFFTQLKVDPKSKKLIVTTKSPEKQWDGVREITFPKGNIFCFFSQVPSCLKFYGFLKNNKKKSLIMIIWDSFPYQGEQYRDIAEGPFQKAQVEVELLSNGDKKIDLNFGNQVINYHYDKDGNFENMYWIAQGISIKSLKEENTEQ